MAHPYKDHNSNSVGKSRAKKLCSGYDSGGTVKPLPMVTPSADETAGKGTIERLGMKTYRRELTRPGPTAPFGPKSEYVK